MSLDLPCIEGAGKSIKGYRGGFVTVGPHAYYGLRQHRVAFEQAWGITLRADQVVRHTCDSPSCVNPLHLQVGTVGDNNRDTRDRGRHRKQQRTHCPEGHPLSGDNLDKSSLAREGARRCRTCINDRHRAAYQRRTV